MGAKRMFQTRMTSAGALLMAVLIPLAVPAGQTSVLQLSMVGPGTGTISSDDPAFSCAATCSYAVASGSTITLTASPGAGSEYVQWIGDCSGNSPTCSLPMNGTKMAIAYFKPQYDPYTILHFYVPGCPDGQRPLGDLLADGGHIYGITYGGGLGDKGTIFKENADGSGHMVLHAFTGANGDGAHPQGSLILYGGQLYGLTGGGGIGDHGLIFMVSTDGSGFRTLHSFTGGDGASPSGPLAVISGVLYGKTLNGGANGKGALFMINPDGSGFQQLHSFSGGAADGAYPSGSLLAFDNVLYGMTTGGGSTDQGVIFRINPDGGGFQLLHACTTDEPGGSLIASGDMFYGLSIIGGSGNQGAIFRMNPDGNGYQILRSFVGGDDDGANPDGSLIESNGMLYGMTGQGGSGNFGTIFKINPDGGGYHVLHSFSGNTSDGAWPSGSSLISSNGVLMGLTAGSDTGGTVFQINADGTGFTLLHLFASEGCYGDGGVPYASLLASGGILYGMTAWGGGEGQGTIFKINPDGNGYERIHDFSGEDGAFPEGALTAFDGELYGMTMQGGTDYLGTIFKINPDGGGFQILHPFEGDADDGAGPVSALTAFNGMLYGMTPHGGVGDYGTLFTLAPDGTDFHLLHAFGGLASDGEWPNGSLTALETLSGPSLEKIFGMSDWGGVNGYGTIFTINPDGSSYQILKSFAEDEDGAYPEGSLIESDGVLYGVTSLGGAGGFGSIFQMQQNGSGFQLLHSFVGGATDGKWPVGAPMAPEGIYQFPCPSIPCVVPSALYAFGMTRQGGAEDRGTLFRSCLYKDDVQLLHSFAGGLGDGASPTGSFAMVNNVLYGTTSEGGFNDLGVIFSLRILPMITGRVTFNGAGLAGVMMTELPGNPLSDADGRYTGIVPFLWSGVVSPGLAGYGFTQPSLTYANISSDQFGQDYTAAVAPPAPPPVKATGAGAAQFTKGSGDTLNVTYDTSACSAQKLIILYGYIGAWNGYSGCAQPDGGNSGQTTIDSEGYGNVWYNLVWTDGITAGHPGYAYDGTQNIPRTWTVGTLCGMSGDDQTNGGCGMAP